MVLGGLPRSCGVLYRALMVKDIGLLHFVSSSKQEDFGGDHHERCDCRSTVWGAPGFVADSQEPVEDAIFECFQPQRIDFHWAPLSQRVPKGGGHHQQRDCGVLKAPQPRRRGHGCEPVCGVLFAVHFGLLCVLGGGSVQERVAEW